MVEKIVQPVASAKFHERDSDWAMSQITRMVRKANPDMPDDLEPQITYEEASEVGGPHYIYTYTWERSDV